MRKGVWSLPFDASTDLVARRELVAGDVSLAPGETVPESAVSPRRLRQLFDMRHVVHRVTYEALLNGVTHFMTDPFAEPVEPVAQPEPVEPVAEPEPAPAEPVAPVASLPGLPGATPTPPAPETEETDDEAALEKLRADAKELGIEVDGRWKAKRLQTEIDKALGDGKSS
jgi:hypothetical protein